MANGQIDIIVAEKAVEEINKVNTELEETLRLIIQISKEARKAKPVVKTPKGLEEQLKKNEKAQNNVNEEVKESLRLNKALVTSREKLKTVTSAENIELQKNRQRLNEANRAIRTLDSAYLKLSKRVLDAKKRAKDLGAQYGLTSKQFKKAQIEAQKLDRRIKKLDKAVGDNQRNVGNYPKIFGSATKAMGAFIGAFGIIEGLRLGVRFVRDLGALAVQMEGESRRSAIVFGESLAFVTREAEKNAIALGLTRREYITAAAATQDLLIPLGFQRKEASRLSVELTNLSGVLSNWVGGQKDAREVSEILTKSILGETEQIKTLGIKIDQTSPSFNRRVKLLQETNDLTREQARALEILNQITTKSADAQAEFAKETKSLAQQEAQANAVLREQMEIFAKDITPSYIRWIKFKTDLAKATGDLIVLLESERTTMQKWGDVARSIFVFGGEVINKATADQIRARIKHDQVLAEAIRVTQNYNKENDIVVDNEKLKERFTKKTTEQLEKQIKIIEKLNETNEETEELLDSSILSLEKIIKKNIELIKTTEDDTYRRRLLQENQLLAQQIKLLLKVPEAVKSINASGVGAAPQIGGTTPEGAEGDFLELPFKFTDFSTTVLDDINDFVDQYGNQIDKAIDITNSFFDNRIERIQQDIDANNEFFANQIALAADNEAEQIRLEEERQKKDAELQKKLQKERTNQAIVNKAFAAANIILNTLTAATAALAPPPIGLGPVAGIPLATTIKILGAANLASTLVAPVPQFAEGGNVDKDTLGILGDAGVHEYLERGNTIFQSPDTDTLVNLKSGDKIHKDLDSLAISKGFDLDAINKAAVMTSIYNDGVRLNSIQIVDAFNKTLDKYQGRIQKEIKNGLKGFKSINNNVTNFDHSIYRQETL